MAYDEYAAAAGNIVNKPLRIQTVPPSAAGAVIPANANPGLLRRAAGFAGPALAVAGAGEALARVPENTADPAASTLRGSTDQPGFNTTGGGAATGLVRRPAREGVFNSPAQNQFEVQNASQLLRGVGEGIQKSVLGLGPSAAAAPVSAAHTAAPLGPNTQPAAPAAPAAPSNGITVLRGANGTTTMTGASDGSANRAYEQSDQYKQGLQVAAADRASLDRLQRENGTGAYAPQGGGGPLRSGMSFGEMATAIGNARVDNAQRRQGIEMRGQDIQAANANSLRQTGLANQQLEREKFAYQQRKDAVSERGAAEDRASALDAASRKRFEDTAQGLAPPGATKEQIAALGSQMYNQAIERRATQLKDLQAKVSAGRATSADTAQLDKLAEKDAQGNYRLRGYGTLPVELQHEDIARHQVATRERPDIAAGNFGALEYGAGAAGALGATALRKAPALSAVVGLAGAAPAIKKYFGRDGAGVFPENTSGVQATPDGNRIVLRNPAGTELGWRSIDKRSALDKITGQPIDPTDAERLLRNYAPPR